MQQLRRAGADPDELAAPVGVDDGDGVQLAPVVVDVDLLRVIDQVVEALDEHLERVVLRVVGDALERLVEERVLIADVLADDLHLDELGREPARGIVEVPLPHRAIERSVLHLVLLPGCSSGRWARDGREASGRHFVATCAAMRPVELAPTRSLCLRCLRPESSCWCRHLQPVQSSTRVVFVQHPRERTVAIGTARMAHLSLPGSELHVGAAFAHHERLNEVARDPEAALLFPGPGALDLATAPPEKRPRTLVVVDGTWANARKLVLRDPLLSTLPRVQFTPSQESRYRIRAEPAEHCVSTIEATVEALGLLEDDPERFKAMLVAFERMIDLQIERRDARVGRSRFGRARRTDPLRPVRSLIGLGERLVIVSAESDATAGESAERGQPKLVHLVAHRWTTAAAFDSLVRPERPLGPRVHEHARLMRAEIESAASATDVMGEFRNFLRPDDVLVAWGSFPFDLLARAGLEGIEQTDLRVVTSEWLHERPGTPLHVVERAGGAGGRPALGRGRAGSVAGEIAALLDAWQQLVVATPPIADA